MDKGETREHMNKEATVSKFWNTIRKWKFKILEGTMKKWGTGEHMDIWTTR